MAREIPLTQGKVAVVDDADYEWLMQWKWHFRSMGYAGRRASKEAGGRALILMHRLITNAPSGLDVDHVDGNRLNNQRSNLRLCTRAQNMRNQRKTKRLVSSQFKGVSLYKPKKWVAYIGLSRHKMHSLGYFHTELEAAHAYDAAARLHFGEFARLNFPAENEQAA